MGTPQLMNNILGGLTGNMGGKGKFNVTSLAGMLAAIAGGNNSTAKDNNFYRYKIATFQVMIEGEDPINILPDAVHHIVITKMYDECIHPIMEVVTNLPPKLHAKIKENKQTLKIRLRIQKQEYSRGNDLKRATDYINSTFNVIMDDEADFKDEDMYDSVNEMQSGKKDNKYVFNMSDYTTKYTLSLWDKNNIDAMCKVVNLIAQNCTVSTALKKLYSESGIKKILISPLDNDKSYSEIRIKPMNLMNIPAYIDKIYGTYYSGSCVFLDYRCLYFLSRNGVCDAKEDGEYTRTIIKIPKAGDSSSKKVGTTKDTTNLFYYMYMDQSAIDFQSPSNTNDAIEGNNFTIVDPKSNETTDVDGAGSQSGNGNSRVVEDNYSNEYNKSTLISDVVESTNVATIECTDYDEDAFTPNKEFVIMFDDPKEKSRNGFYRLKESMIVLNKTSAGLDITGKHQLVFKSPISSGSSDSNASAKEVKTLSPNTSNKSASGKAAKTNISTSTNGNTPQKEQFKPATPKPKLSGVNQNVVNTSGASNSGVKTNPQYEYDELGNVKGFDIPEYNKISSDDSTAVVNKKKAAQQKALPSGTPKPRMTA